MEHAKKLVLLPQECLERLQDFPSQLSSSQTPGTTLSRLDAEMHRILNADDKNEREKWTRYQQVLQRYLHFKDAAVKKDTTTSGDSETKKNSDIEKIDEVIIESLPQKYRNKATKLLRSLRDAGNVKWDNNQLLINGALVHGHIVDLVNDAMRARRGNPPHGHREFASALRSASIPLEYIGNQRVKLIVGASVTPVSLSDSNQRTVVDRSHHDAEEEVTSPEITSTPTSRSGQKRKKVSLQGSLKQWRRLNQTLRK